MPLNPNWQLSPKLAEAYMRLLVGAASARSLEVINERQRKYRVVVKNKAAYEAIKEAMYRRELRYLFIDYVSDRQWNIQVQFLQNPCDISWFRSASPDMCQGIVLDTVSGKEILKKAIRQIDGLLAAYVADPRRLTSRIVQVVLRSFLSSSAALRQALAPYESFDDLVNKLQLISSLGDQPMMRGKIQQLLVEAKQMLVHALNNTK